MSLEWKRKIIKTANAKQGYDHSYYFISSFSTDHVNHAAKYVV
jgi:S-formylglutathione hydrolase FrmB